ncbi:pantoate--beta-alanine ligase [Pontibaca methylaminivorans]|uniref:Pantothenate synthetase n=1 Tax=Pontibaca methylaminivorans TaxID=515897 RepID=A0A1R3WRE1_9RHOB|nr:pantoate--beta-alanine ligase [Pontibaca methylaminivorans]SIT80780.1 pantothenate synthetase [Pontibaca methylaminivorans]
MKIIRDKSALRALVSDWHRQGHRIGVVPTMGALHAGHLALVKAARKTADRVIVTLFVNPRQFNDPTDLANYPRSEDRDAKALAPLGPDVLYAPDPDQIYPEGFATTITVAGISDVLCGASRPGHFDGVATVVTKLLLQTGADIAFFGEKDFQQVQLIRRLVRDLDLCTEIVACPTQREADGLALSSRNLRLSPEARATAPALHRIMAETAAAIRQGTAPDAALASGRAALQAAGFGPVDYFDLRHEDDLSPATAASAPAPARPARIFAAAWLDGVRLIDNLALAT